MPPTEQTQARAWERYQAGDSVGAEAAARQLLAADPRNGSAWYLLGVVALDRSQLAHAVECLNNAVAAEPQRAEYLHALGEAYRLASNTAQAIATLETAVRLEPRRAASHNALGLALLDRAEHERAQAAFLRAIECDPGYQRAHLNLGRALQLRDDLDGAADCYAAALRIQPNYAIAHNNLGVVWTVRGKPKEAIACFREALRCAPDYPEAHFNLGTSLQGVGLDAEAAAHLQSAIRLRPTYAKAYFNLGRILETQRRDFNALHCYQEAVRLQPDDAEMQRRLGDLLVMKKDWPEAIAALERSCRLQPDDPNNLARLVHARQQICDWRTYETDVERLWSGVVESLAAGKPTPVVPMQALTLPWSRERLQIVAKSYCDDLARHRQQQAESIPFIHRPEAAPRLRIGYLSGDIYDHPIAHLLCGLFGRHDRAEFEIFCYSFGPPDDSVYRRKIEAECEHFVNVVGISAVDLARRIHADGIHILVDLMGHTGVNRFATLAHKPAPIQVSFLGMLGTMGADFIDYLIADPIAAPPEFAADFTEKLVTMPHSYLIAEPTALPPGPVPDRTVYGLPPTGFVFCSFNNTYKFEPRMFRVWMRILEQTPGSVLWLFSSGAITEDNLRREAAAYGIDPARLIFAGFLPREQHLPRHLAADLFLDTTPYNAAATSSLALQCGLPVLTNLGETFSARVGASLLSAVGLPELIAADLAEYERTAIRLAHDPQESAELRARLLSARTTSPLFDTLRFARNLERAYRTMWTQFAEEGHPRAFEVREN
jgi:protein O-GlcNAc transferase